MKNRLMAISNLLAQYSIGNFDYEIPLSNKLDEIDSIISSINMLGEELQATTISRDFFSIIYNTVSNLLFVVNEQGIITEANETALGLLSDKQLLGLHFEELYKYKTTAHTISKLKQKIKSNKGIHKFETEFIVPHKQIIQVSCSIKKIESNQIKGYFIVAEDITQIKEVEKQILRTVIETEELERKRVADDLHDSLGQGLSSIKMMLGVAKQNSGDKKQTEIISTSIDILENSIQEIRNICFNLMPSILEKGGLTFAIQQLIDNTAFDIEYQSNTPTLRLSKKQEVAVYRVLQEFVNNSMKHSQGSKIDIHIYQTKNKTEFYFSDNGIGFKKQINPKLDNRGLNTMRSRIESFGGEYQLVSIKGHGVQLKISF
jgi:PAS domain S-box-containing protein